jgi:hypothetical protein
LVLGLPSDYREGLAGRCERVKNGLRGAVGRDVKGSYDEREIWRWRGGREMSGAAVTGGRETLAEQRILPSDETAEGRREAEEAPGR